MAEKDDATRTPKKDGIAMPPLCDEMSGGGGSSTDTRDRAPPGKEGDCARIGNEPPKGGPEL